MLTPSLQIVCGWLWNPGSLREVALGLICSSILFCSCSSGNREAAPAPVLSGPPNTTFPMPPGSSANMAELGWVVMADKDRQVSRAKIADYKGKVLILDLYATWCAPCRVSIPHLIKLQHRYKADGLEIVGLNVGGPDDRVKVKDFAKEFGIDYSLGFPDQALSDFFLSDDSGIPQTFVFSRDGTLQKRFIGYDEATTGKLLDQLIQNEVTKSDTDHAR